MATPEIHTAVSEFLAHEARLLDYGREHDWLDLLADDLLYEIPIRSATEPRREEFDLVGYRIRDTKKHMETRISRLDTGHAYSEVPPSRTLRLIGSVEVHDTENEGEYTAYSSLLVYRQRGIDPHFDLIPARREDLIRFTPAGARLVRRRVLNTETSLETPNLAVIL